MIQINEIKDNLINSMFGLGHDFTDSRDYYFGVSLLDTNTVLHEIRTSIAEQIIEDLNK